MAWAFFYMADNKLDEIVLKPTINLLLLSEIMLWHLFADGEPIKLPENLESLPRADHFPTQRHRWNTNEVSPISYLVYLNNVSRLAVS